MKVKVPKLLYYHVLPVVNKLKFNLYLSNFDYRSEHLQREAISSSNITPTSKFIR